MELLLELELVSPLDDELLDELEELELDSLLLEELLDVVDDESDDDELGSDGELDELSDELDGSLDELGSEGLDEPLDCLEPPPVPPILR